MTLTFSRNLQAEMRHDFLQIFPDFPFGIRVPQQIRWMVGRQHGDAAKVEPLAAQARDGLFGAVQSLERCSTQANNRFRFDYGKLPKEKWRTSVHFVWFRSAIFGRTALDHIADVNVVALEAHGFNHLSEQFSGATDEGQALDVFVAAGPFPDEDKLRLSAAAAENNLVALLAKTAPLAIANVFSDAFEGIVFNGLAAVKKRRRLYDWRRRSLR